MATRKITTRDFWRRKTVGTYCQQERKEKEETRRQELERRAEARRKMREWCKGYNRQPIIGMTDKEAVIFSEKQAQGAREVMRIYDGGRERAMYQDEASRFAAAIYSSIAYFNNRSEEHSKIMKFRDKCRIEAERKKQAEAQRQTEELAIRSTLRP